MQSTSRVRWWCSRNSGGRLGSPNDKQFSEVSSLLGLNCSHTPPCRLLADVLPSEEFSHLKRVRPIIVDGAHIVDISLLTLSLDGRTKA